MATRYTYPAIRKNINKYDYSTKVKALDNQPLMRSDSAASAVNEEPTLNLSRRAGLDRRKPKRGLSKPSKSYKIATFNCRTLQHQSPQAEFNKLLNDYTIDITCVQEHRFVHADNEPEIVIRDIGSSVLFTSTASRNSIGASIHGVGIAINSKMLPLLETVDKHDNCIICATFKGNPKTTVIACYSPHNALDESIITDFYQKLSQVIEDVPSHSMLFIGGDMNAQVNIGFSYHSSSNRNGLLLHDFIQQHNLVIGNTSFQKKPSQLWTHRSPSGALSQIDFVLYRKRWRNSISECRAFSSSNPVGSDHRMVTATVKLSLRRPTLPKKKKLYWKALSLDKALATKVGNTISERFYSLPPPKQDYSSFVSVATSVGTELLPKRPPRPTKTVDIESVVAARKATLRASTQNIQSTQKNLRKTYDSYEDKRINNILRSFETPAAVSVIKNAWDLVKTLSGKKSRSTIFIEGDDRLKTWENHFKNLLNADVAAQPDMPPIQKIFDTFSEINCGDLTQDEVDSAIRILKNGKAPGLDGLPPEFGSYQK